MSWTTKGWIGFSAPEEGKIHDIVLSSKESGWGIQNFVKSQTATTRMRQGFPLSLAQTYWEYSREGKNAFEGHIALISEDRDVKMIDI